MTMTERKAIKAKVGLPDEIGRADLRDHLHCRHSTIGLRAAKKQQCSPHRRALLSTLNDVKSTMSEKKNAEAHQRHTRRPYSCWPPPPSP
jgi:hypothetical protein